MPPATQTLPQTMQPSLLKTEAPEPKPLLDSIMDGVLTNAEKTVELAQHALADETMSLYRRNVLTGMAVMRLKEALNDDVMNILMNELMNNEVGFKTDKSKPNDRYDKETVKRCAIQAILHGLSWCGNEWNIMFGGCMIVKNGWKRKVEETPGVTDLDGPDVTPPFVHPGVKGLVVKAYASWKFNGQRMSLSTPDGKGGQTDGVIFHVKGDAGSADALVGKGERKAYAMIYRRVNGTLRTLPDEAGLRVVDEVPATPRPTVADVPPPEVKGSDTAPAVGDARFIENMTRWDAKLVTEGLAQSGEFLEFLRSSKLEPLEDWPAGEERKTFVNQKYQQFRSARLDAKKDAPLPNGHDEPPAFDSAETLDSDDRECARWTTWLTHLLKADNRTETWGDVLKRFTLVGTTKMSDLTYGQAEAIALYLTNGRAKAPPADWQA